MTRSRAADGPGCTGCTDGSVHEPVHDLLLPLADSNYTALPPSPPAVWKNPCSQRFWDYRPSRRRVMLAGFEGIRRGLDLNDVGLPAGLGENLVVISSRCAVDEFPDDVGVARVLCGLPDHQDH